MFKWFRPTALDPLSVSMAGAKLGDRVLVLGCSDPHLIAALAAKTGLTGRACAVDESPELATEAGRIALREGALVETSSATPSALAFEGDSFDLVILRDVLGTRDRESLEKVVWETRRVLRPGGRCMVIDSLGRSGMAAVLGGKAAPATNDASELIEIFKNQGFVAVRTLAERDRLRFIEAIKKSS